jgi:hypothetical protein
MQADSGSWLWFGGAHTHKEHIVNQASQASSDQPPSAEASFPVRAFGCSTERYWTFLEALMSGLRAYEARQRGRTHAPNPVPAA